MRLRRNNTNFIKLAVTLATMPLWVFALMLISSELTQSTYANTLKFNLDPEGYFVDITARDSMTLNLVSTAGAMYGAMKDTINIRTNADSYKLYLSMSSDQLDSSSQYTNNLYLNSDNTEVSNKLSPTSGTTASTSTLGTNSWGYAIPGYSNFSAASAYSEDTTELSPDALWANVPVYGNADVIAEGSEQPSTAGDDVDIYYGVKANTSIAAGVYAGKVTYSAVTDSSITLSELGSVSPSVLSQISGGETVQITLALNATLEQVGNNIIVNIGSGTCTSPTASLNQAGNVVITCTSPANLPGTYDVSVNLVTYGRTYYIGGGVSYIYSGTAALDDMIATLGDQMNTITSTNRDFYNLTTMQGMTSAICNSVATPKANVTKVTSSLAEYNIYTELLGEGYIVPEIHLRDTRDSQVYTVRKLADGNCWMTENLRYGAGLDGNARAYTSTDAALSNNMNTSSGNGNMNNLTTARITKNNSESGWFADNDTYYQYPYVAIYQANDYDTVTDTNTKYGALYNFCAATGGTSCTVKATTPTTPTGSVCPASWKLPSYATDSYNPASAVTDGSDDSYNNLRNVYSLSGDTTGIARITSAPLSFPRSGGYFDGSLNGRNSAGWGSFWSSSPVGSGTPANAYYLDFNNSGVYRYNLSRRSGRSVRCLAS